MSNNFAAANCQTQSNKKLFGLCDDPPPASNRAYIDENNGAAWIAVVVNEEHYEVTFTAIDNCIDVKRTDGKMDKRCDGVLTFNSSVIFVELKMRDAHGNAWVIDAESQLRTTIGHFEKRDDAEEYSHKKAYIANSKHPKFKETQIRRMDQFFIDTGYILRIENRIIL